MQNTPKEVIDFFTTTKSHSWFRSVFPTVLNLYNYKQKDDENRKNFIMKEAAHMLNLPNYNPFEDEETLNATIELMKIKAQWWFENFRQRY